MDTYRMRVDEDNQEIERNYFSGRLHKRRDINTGFTRGSCYAMLDGRKEIYFHKKRNEIGEVRAMRRQ